MARVVHLPGHSSGSIGILTDAGTLFCGDLLENTRCPAAGSIIDDPSAVGASLACLGELPVAMVYPGHGAPFEGGELRAIVAAQMSGQLIG